MGQMTPEQRRQKWRDRYQRRKEGVGRDKPSGYREAKDRLVHVQGMVDIRKMATVHSFLLNKYGVDPYNKSEFLRTIIDTLYAIISGEEESEDFHLHKDAFVYLEEYGLSPATNKRHKRSMEMIIGSESFDIEQGDVQTGEEDKKSIVVEAGQLLLNRGTNETIVRNRVRDLCEEYDLDYQDVIKKVIGWQVPTGKKDKREDEEIVVTPSRGRGSSTERNEEELKERSHRVRQRDIEERKKMEEAIQQMKK